MGTPNIIVGSIPGSAQRLFNVGASGEFTVQNVGTVVIYLDDDSSVSQQTNEYFLLPGNTITWQAGVECWALAASGTGFVSLATSVTQYDNTAFTNGAIIASGNFVGLPMSNFLPLINTLGYLSVRITIKSANTQVVGTNTGSAIILFWNDTSGGSVGSGATVGQDVYYMNEGLLGWNGCEIVTDVRGTTLTIRNALIPTISGAFYNYVVRGYNTRVPPLALEYDDGVNSGSALYTTKSINYTETVAAAGQVYTLPMWSGIKILDVLCSFLTHMNLLGPLHL